jgi:hypothetical protein
MRKLLLSAAAAASLLAVPAFAQTAADRLSSDQEVRWQQEWDQLVAKTNADRHAPVLAIGAVAAVTGNSATDAAQAPARNAPQRVPTGPYSTTLQILQDK